jgi:NTP pyrophosphatase (non-canonical NTP hydrolase)
MEKILSFRDAREWRKFHTPRNLAAALAIEASELQEELLWKSDKEVKNYLRQPARKKALEEEIADVLTFALLFCHETGINPIEAINNKLKLNAKKYPIHLAKGNAVKYSRRDQ